MAWFMPVPRRHCSHLRSNFDNNRRRRFREERCDTPSNRSGAGRDLQQSLFLLSRPGEFGIGLGRDLSRSDKDDEGPKVVPRERKKGP